MDILMDLDYWLIAGLLLVFAEIVLPGGIVFFLGAGALVVALGIFLGIVTSWTGALTVYFVSSLLLILLLRGFVMRFVGGDSTRANTIEILDDVGELVKVVETIGPANNAGRIEFRGTEWQAVGDGSEIRAGENARIIARENVQYIVEKADDAGAEPTK